MYFKGEKMSGPLSNISGRTTVGCFQYGDGKNTAFAGAEGRYNFGQGYAGVAGYVVTDNFENAYGLVDLKGKVNYDDKGIVEGNVRVRTAFDDDLKSTQIRISPCTVNVPIVKGVSLYNNLNYAGKYDYQNEQWKHSASDFLGVSWDVSKKVNLSLEGQAYNLQKAFTPEQFQKDDWSVNFFATFKF